VHKLVRLEEDEVFVAMSAHVLVQLLVVCAEAQRISSVAYLRLPHLHLLLRLHLLLTPDRLLALALAP